MSDTASDTAPAAALHPDPDRAASARLSPAGVGNILRLLHTLVGYGTNVVHALRRERDPDDLPWYPVLTRIFGTTNPALITIIVIRGLLRATVLQARLGSGFALALALAPRPITASPPSPRRPPAPAPAIPAGWPPADYAPTRPLTTEEGIAADIAAEDHDRPLGAILVDIYLELGIVPQQMDPALWDELRRAITLYGGDPAPLIARAAATVDAVGRVWTAPLVQGRWRENF